MGPSARPWFQVRDGFAYAVDAHPEGACAEPSFVVLGGGVYPVEADVEPGTGGSTPWFRVSTEAS